MIAISEHEFERILAEKRQLQANLTACQKLCNEQLEEIRKLRLRPWEAAALLMGCEVPK